MTNLLIRPVAAAALGALLLLGPAVGVAKDKKDHDAARAALARREVLPLTRILSIAEQRAPGDVLKVKLDEDDGRLIYEVKVLGRDGRVRELELDAKTGATIKLEED